MNSSSLMKVEGNLVAGYDVDGDSQIEGLVWSMGLVLSVGEVDLSETAIEVSIFVANNNESRLAFNSSLDDEADFFDNNFSGGYYGMVFFDEVHPNNVLDAGEIVRFFVKLEPSSEISQNDKVMIFIVSGVAAMKVSKKAPTAIVAGLNLLR